MAERIAFIGLGVMGGPMAALLLRAGFDVCVYNRTATKAKAWVVEHGGRSASTPREAVNGSAFVLSCVGNDDDLRNLANADDGVLSGVAAGTVWIDHTTTSRTVAVEVAAAAAARGVDFLDAPVSGGESGAREGKLSVMVGGLSEALERSMHVLDVYSKRVEHIGESGAGQLAKMVNQICIAGLLQGLSEGLRFGERAGLDMQRVLRVVSQGAAQSWQMDNRAQTMLERRFEFGFAVDWMCKDLGLCLAEAARSGTQLPVTREVAERYERLAGSGRGRFDTSSLIALLDEDP